MSAGVADILCITQFTSIIVHNAFWLIMEGFGWSSEVQAQSTNENTVHRVVLPYKDQKSADAVKKQLSDLSKKIDHTLQPVFNSRKICEDLTKGEEKAII